MDDMTEVGTHERAAEIAAYHHDDPSACVDGFEFLAKGEHRTVYIDWDAGTVYKVGSDRANRREHAALSGAAGATWAPATSLYEVTVSGAWGNEIDCTVVAMPYLPDEGGEAAEGINLADLVTVAGDLNLDNLHVNGGKLWLIDAGGV